MMWIGKAAQLGDAGAQFMLGIHDATLTHRQRTRE